MKMPIDPAGVRLSVVPSIVTGTVTTGSAVCVEIPAGPPPGIAKTMLAGMPPASACVIASVSEPGPLLPPVVTVKVGLTAVAHAENGELAVKTSSTVTAVITVLPGLGPRPCR